MAQDDYDGEVWCDYCVARPGTRGKLGLYVNRDLRDNAAYGGIAFGRMKRSRRRPNLRVGFHWRSWEYAHCRNCGAMYDTSQEALQRAYALRDRDTGRIRLTERLSVRR